MSAGGLVVWIACWWLLRLRQKTAFCARTCDNGPHFNARTARLACKSLNSLPRRPRHALDGELPAMRTTLVSAFAALGCLLSADLASAHVGASTPTPYANATAELTLSVGHGCEGYDTQSVQVTIPSGVTGLRVVESWPFTSVTTVKDAGGNVTSVTFSKPQERVREADDAYYKLVVRAKLPDKPFTTLYFPAIQTCKSKDGNVTPAPNEWVGTTPNEGEMGPEPAPALLVLPARTPGWNKYTLPAGVEFTKAQLATVFKDALIVWADKQAYSVNPNTAALIAAESGVEALESLAGGTEIWVKY